MNYEIRHYYSMYCKGYFLHGGKNTAKNIFYSMINSKMLLQFSLNLSITIPI